MITPAASFDFTTGLLDPKITFARALSTATEVNSSGLVVGASADSTAPLGVQVVSESGHKSGQVRIVNTGNVTVHLGVGPTAAAAQANAVAATAGNPAAGIPMVAGAVEILRFQADAFFSGLASEATTVYITPGTGL